MPQLQINRSNEYSNRLRNIKLFLDGKELAAIKNNETLVFDIPAGVHQLKATIDWCSSNTVAFNIAGGKKNFDLTSFAKHNRLGMLSAIYYATLATHKYLHLAEVAAA